MPRLIKQRSKKSGLPPGTLVHIGEQRAKSATIEVISYDETTEQETMVTNVEQCFPFREKSGVTWINVEGLHQTEIIQRLGDCYGFHPLVLEDILNTDQRPKLEDYGDYLYIVLKMLHNGKSPELRMEQISTSSSAKTLSFRSRRGLRGMSSATCVSAFGQARERSKGRGPTTWPMR